MSSADAELLQDYAMHGSQRAFATLVTRYIDLVYSAARRQVGSRQLAEEVSQAVFIALARNSDRLKPGTPMVAWLYLVTRRTAIDALRSESRRQMREQIAMEMNAMNSGSSDWPRIEPVLDEAMASLGDSDRSAILMRFFEDKSLRDVGVALGTSEDAAQKRVSRALDQLRTFFLRRGVAVGAASLATSLSAHAVQSAPIGLGLSISSTAAVAATVAGQATALGGVKLLVMTTVQKTFIATTLALTVGIGFYERQANSRLTGQLSAARQQAENLRAQLQQLQRERDAATARWAAMQSEIDAARATLARDNSTTGARDFVAESEMKAVLERVTELKRRVAALTGSRARASGLLTKEDWIKVALENRLESDAEVKKALDNVQDQVKLKWTELLQTALGEFTKASGGLLPSDCAQLAPFLPPGSDPSMLQRFQMLRTGSADAAGDAWLVADVGAVDDDTESLVIFGRGNTLIGSDGRGERRVILRAYVDFIRTHSGQVPGEPAQLQPYLRRPIDTAELQNFWKQHGHLLR